MSSINPVSRSMNGIKTIETASLIFTDDNSSLNTSAGIVSAQANSTTALNGKINSVGFNTSNGVLTLTKEDGTTLTKDLDGRYLTSIDSADIPNLPASKITSGTFGTARIPDLDADKIASGTLGTARIPNLPASQINSGTFGTARIPDLDADKIASGTLGTARIPNLPASQINSGTFGTARIPALPYVSVGTAQAHTDETIFGVKTFNEPPVCSTAPTSGNQLANRSYVLANAGGSGDAVLSAGSEASPQDFTGFNKFDNITTFNQIEIEPPTNATNTTLLQTAPNYNLLQQELTTTNSEQGNLIFQIGGQRNRIYQYATGTYLNHILQEGINSLIETEGTLDTANIVVNSTAVSNPLVPLGGNIQINNSTSYQNGKLFIGTPPSTAPIFSATNPASSYFCLVRGGIYVDGEEGIRIPRRGLYDRTGEREWRIDHYSGGGSSQSGVNCLTFNFSTSLSAFGNFLTRARLQSNGRLELDANILQNQNFSDDRLKTNEAYLENATESLLKLSVQTYDKASVNNFNLNEKTGKTIRETGLIAQEVYYNAPEFRGLISAGREYNDEFDLSGNQIGDGKPEGTEIIPDEMDLSGVPIGEDPDYEAAGWSKTERASIEYQGFIAYLIKSNQELHERILKLEAKIM